MIKFEKALPKTKQGKIIPREIEAGSLVGLENLAFDVDRQAFAVLGGLVAEGDGGGGVFRFSSEDSLVDDGYDVIQLTKEYSDWKLVRVNDYPAWANVLLFNPPVDMVLRSGDAIEFEGRFLVTGKGPWSVPVNNRLKWLGKDTSVRVGLSATVSGKPGDKIQVAFLPVSESISDETPIITLDDSGYGALSSTSLSSIARGSEYRLMVRNLTSGGDVRFLFASISLIRMVGLGGVY